MSDRPLSDVTVLELGHIVAGPFCSLLLADMGARVIKVEHPKGGDLVRDSSPLGNSSFNYVNRDKESITLDLKTDDGVDIFHQLLDDADVVVENFKPGTAERLGVGYDSLKEPYPRLVYCSIKGFNEGPYADHPALDPVAEALSGLMSVTGHPGEPPVRSGTSVADMAASLYGAIGILAALRQREETGEGQKVSAPLFESTVALMGYWLSFTQAYNDVPEPLGAGHPNWAPYDVFRSADEKWVFVGPSGEHQWHALCRALDLSLHEDSRFETIADRRENVDVLTDLLAVELRQFDRTEIVDKLREASVPVAPVNNIREVCDDPHLEATDALTTVHVAEGDGDSVNVPRSPIRSSAFSPIDSEDPPTLGEHTGSILASLGYSSAEIDALREQGAI